MSMRAHLSGLVIVALSAGCSFEIPSDRFACASRADCPPGFECAEGFCFDEVTPGADGGRDSGAIDSGSNFDCPPLTAPSNGFLVVASRLPGGAATYHCDAANNYQLVGNGGQPTRVCQPDLTWSGTAPACLRTSCRIPIVPANGRVDRATTANPGETATYACDDDFALIGSAVLTCESDFEWDDAPPSCVSTLCPALEPPSNGSLGAHSNAWGDAVAYACDTFYFLVGNGGDRTRICQESLGTWSGEAPRCDPTGGYPIWPIPGGSGSAHPRSYDVRANVVLDEVTGLMWQRGTLAGAFDWESAKAGCEALTLDGHDDWRLPGRMELYSLVDFARSPRIAADFNVVGSPYWTASTYAPTPANAWSIDFASGLHSTAAAKTTTMAARCVR